ncbi:MAG: 30S ribosomal protein S20 [Thermodesulfovibrionales bacterium]
MANKPVKRNPSALKRARQAEKRRLRNQAVRSAVRTYTRKFLEALQSNDGEKINAAYMSAVKVLNRASSAGILKRNNASRRISGLSKKLYSFTSGQAA